MRREEGQKVVLYSQVDFKLFVCDTTFGRVIEVLVVKPANQVLQV